MPKRKLVRLSRVPIPPHRYLLTSYDLSVFPLAHLSCSNVTCRNRFSCFRLLTLSLSFMQIGAWMSTRDIVTSFGSSAGKPAMCSTTGLSPNVREHVATAIVCKWTLPSFDERWLQLPILTTSLIHFSLKGSSAGNDLFELGSPQNSKWMNHTQTRYSWANPAMSNSVISNSPRPCFFSHLLWAISNLVIANIPISRSVSRSSWLKSTLKYTPYFTPKWQNLYPISD